MIVVLDNLRSALNVGSIIRTCDSFGIKEIYICGITPGIDNHKVKKTSLGAEKSINFTHFSSAFDAIKKLKDGKFRIISLEIAESAKDISAYKRKSRFEALVIGNEISGVSDEILNVSDDILMIPMRGRKESLNVSVAFGIASYCLSHRK